MTKDLLLLLTGAVIALVSGAITMILEHYLSLREDRIKRERDRQQRARDELVPGPEIYRAHIRDLGRLIEGVMSPRRGFAETSLEAQQRRTIEALAMELGEDQLSLAQCALDRVRRAQELLRSSENIDKTRGGQGQVQVQEGEREG